MRNSCRAETMLVESDDPFEMGKWVRFPAKRPATISELSTAAVAR
jgi:hypothetical protein